MLEFARGLTDRQLRALAELEMRVVGADGGRLKLEWGVLRSRPGKYVEDFLWWEGDALVGFLGVYAFGAPTVEITGMVDPSARRRGIATALLDAALPVCRERRYQQVLLVTPGGSSAGQALATNRNAELEHSEHALLLTDTPADGPTDSRISVRRATQADVPELAR
jgi:GNAT superfamily N-acetyltransferase